MLRLFEGLFFILVATVIVWQWIIPALRDEPLFPWFRYRHLHRERARAQHARYEARLREEAAREWRAAYSDQDATTQESTRWPEDSTNTPRNSNRIAE